MAVYNLRAHHLFRLVSDFQDGYITHEDCLRHIKVRANDVVRRAYTDETAARLSAFYLEISSNPQNTVRLVEGADDICSKCNNYTGQECVLFTASQLALDDVQTLADFFPNLQPGAVVSVERLLSDKSVSRKVFDIALICLETT